MARDRSGARTVGLFVAALPFAWGDAQGSVTLLVGLGVALVLAGCVLRGDRIDRLEVGLAAVALAFTIGLSLWRFDENVMDTANLPAGAVARAVLSVVAYLVVASGYAVLGGMRDTGRLTWLATAALVVFVTVQAFAVFARSSRVRRCSSSSASCSSARASWPTAADDGS